MARDIEELASAQAAFGLAARLVWQEPDQQWVQTCIDQDVFACAPFGMEDAAVVEGLSLLRAWCVAAVEDVPEAVGAIQREWLRLFIGLGAPKAPIWEGCYTDPNAAMFSRSTLDVRTAYRAWGLAFQRKGKEPDDSLGIMLAFCSHLMECQIQAVEAGDEDTAQKAAAALEDFMVAHLLPWASAWRFLVKEHARTDYYRGVGELVFGLERAYAKLFGVECNDKDGTFAYAKHDER